MAAQVYWGNFLRDVCQDDLLRDPVVVGGHGVDANGQMYPKIVPPGRAGRQAQGGKEEPQSCGASLSVRGHPSRVPGKGEQWIILLIPIYVYYAFSVLFMQTEKSEYAAKGFSTGLEDHKGLRRK